MSQAVRPTLDEVAVTRHDPAIGALFWVVAFAVGVIIDAVQFGEPPVSLFSVATMAAVGVVLAPRSRGRLVLLTGSLGAASLWYLPGVWNHWILVGVLGVALTVMAFSVRASDGGRPTNAELVARAAPFLRLAFLATFGLAAFSKLNRGFLDLADSCAIWVYETYPFAPALPEPGRWLMIGGSLAIEIAIPLLLIFRRTRWAGIIVGWVFHLATALAGHAAFAGFAWSFYLLFLPRPVLVRATAIALDRWRATVGHLPVPSRSDRLRPVLWPVLGVAVLALIAVGENFPFGPPGRASRGAAALLYLAWSIATGLIVLRAARESRGHREQETVGSGYWRVGTVGAVGLAVIFASGASPYLGFKTQYSFTMYSDLRTEAGEWNHLIVPESVKVGAWQDDLVEVTSTDDAELANELHLPTDGSVLIPLLEMRRVSHLYPEAAVTYRYAGVTAETTQMGRDPILGEDLPWIMRKVARFRPARTPSDSICQH